MSELNNLHYINVGPNGTFKPSGKLFSTPQDVDHLFQHLKETGADKLSIHFHGGLIKEKKGADIAKKMADLFLEAGSHPLTFVWETGLGETLKNNLTEIGETKLFQKVVKYVIRHAAKKLGGGIGHKGPGQAMSLSEIEEELAKAEKFDEFDAGARGAAAQLDAAELEEMLPEIHAELQLDLEADDEIETLLEEEAPRTELLDQAALQEIDSDKARGVGSLISLAKILVRVVYRVLRRFLDKRDHGFYPTVVEEVLREFYLADFGEWVWGNMKEQAVDMWKPNNGPIDTTSHVGTYFLEKLADYQAANPAFIVDLTGHSAGSITICNMLATAAKRQLQVRIRNVLVLAPACTSELFHTEIVQHPERYENFRMFTMTDDYECKDQLVPNVYTRSLLYFISGVLEGTADLPLAGLELQSRGKHPYTDGYLLEVSEFLHKPGSDRMVLSVTTTTAPGLQSRSEKHGDFDDDPLTRSSIKTIIAQ
jgi:hypothetical protein